VTKTVAKTVTKETDKKSLKASKGKPEAAVNKYSGEDITVLEGLEPVRQRPGMFIGSTDSKGLHHLLWEVVDNSVDEALAGYCDTIIVELNDKGVVAITDNGRGIPVDEVPGQGKSGVEVVLTTLHAGGKFGGDGYKVAGGLHGVGVSVVNALSRWVEITVRRDGYEWEARFERGQTVKPLKRGPKLQKSDVQGTTVRFLYDDKIFEKDAHYAHAVIEERLRAKAHLLRGLTFKLRAPGHKEKTFKSKDGLAEMIADMNSDRSIVNQKVLSLVTDDPRYAQYVSDDPVAKEIEIDIALQWTDSSKEHVYSFANVVSTPGEGKHVEGMKAALTKALNNYGRERRKIKNAGHPKNDDSFKGDDVMAGLAAAVSVKIMNPQFEGQTKDKLNNSEARTAVYSFAYGAFTAWLEDTKNSKEADRILERVVASRDLREAYGKMSQKSRDAARSMFVKSGLPGKLVDCKPNVRPVEERELFIVEGDSAKGSGVNARDSDFQAILPIRGKMQNVLGAKDAQIWKKTQKDEPLEIEMILNAMGGRKDVAGRRVVATLNTEMRRYGKIIIAADADADGSHIRNLLLTMFYELMPQLIQEGRVFVALPPLFKVALDNNGHYEYAWTKEEMTAALKKHKRTGKDVNRFKGLGEMQAEDLKRTAFHPETRRVVQVTINDAAEANEALNLIMGNSAERRRRWLEDVGLNFGGDDEIDISAFMTEDGDALIDSGADIGVGTAA
jgi:DNA gyrase subunit B